MNKRIRRVARKGFTLIEILIVVVILGILAAIVIPQFTNAAQDANVSSAQSQLQTVRSQIELFRVQNDGALPGSIQDLVDAGMLQEVPTAPADWTFDYDNSTGDYNCLDADGNDQGW